MIRRPRLASRALVYVGLIVLVTIVLYPVMLVCKKAFEPGRDFALSASPIPHTVTTDHFRDLFGARGGRGELLFLRQTLNSVVVALLTTVVGVMLSCTAAYALSRFRFPGRKAGLTSFLVVQMFPATLLLMPLYVILDKLGLLNSMMGLGDGLRDHRDPVLGVDAQGLLRHHPARAGRGRSASTARRRG